MTAPRSPDSIHGLITLYLHDSIHFRTSVLFVAVYAVVYILSRRDGETAASNSVLGLGTLLGVFVVD